MTNYNKAMKILRNSLSLPVILFLFFINLMAQNSSFKIPFEFAGNHIYLPVNINNSETVWMMFDTGASQTRIFKRRFSQRNNAELSKLQVENQNLQLTQLGFGSNDSHPIDGKPYEIPKKINRIKINLSDEILNRYVGKYSLEADYNQTFTILNEGNKLFITDKDGEKVEMMPDSETTFFYDPKSKDGYVFTLNPQTNKYDLTIISTGLKLKTKRIE